jgi:hypothetical protein
LWFSFKVVFSYYGLLSLCLCFSIKEKFNAKTALRSYININYNIIINYAKIQNLKSWQLGKKKDCYVNLGPRNCVVAEEISAIKTKARYFAMRKLERCLEGIRALIRHHLS